MTYRAILFAAVSTEAQAAEDHASLDVQLAQCRAVCAARGWYVVGEVRVEGHSRNYDWLHQLVADSPEYGEFIHAIEAETADLVVVRDYDRLWRTDALRAQVTALCRQHHAQGFSCNQPVEPVAAELLAGTDTARLSEVLFGFISEQENRTRARRCKAGIEQGRVMHQGLHHASNPPYGYRRGATSQEPMSVFEPEAVHLRWIFARRAEGCSVTAIVQSLSARGIPAPGGGNWRDSTVYRLLRYETYVGVAHWGSARNASGIHRALIDADTWMRVQTVNRLRTNIAVQRKGPFLLTGLIKCGHCGRACSYCPTPAGHYYVRCDRHVRDISACLPNSWRAGAVEAHVLSAVKSALADPAAWEADRRLDSGNGYNAARVASLDVALGDAQTRLGRWDSLYESGGITANELLLHRQEIHGQVEVISAEHDSLLETQRALETGVSRLAGLAGLLTTLDAMNRDEQRQLIRALVARVRVFQTPDPHIVIDWL